jgi:hypothetical protein
MPLDVLLAAHDAGCWQVAMGQLNEQLDIEEEFFEDLRDRARLAERGRTRAQVLRPHTAQLARIVQAAEDPAVLAAAARLLGHAGDAAHVGVIRPLVDHEQSQVADAAAAAVAMLGQRDGFQRLAAIFDRSQPSWEENREARIASDRLETDALIGLACLGDDASVDLLGKTLLEDLRGLTVKTNDKGREYLDGRPRRTERITSLLGLCDNARAVRWLMEATRFYEEHEDVSRLADRLSLVQALLEYEEQTRELIAEQIAAADFSYIRAFKSNGHYDPYYVPAVHKMMLIEDKTAWTAHQGVTYLWNVGTPEALAVLQDAHAKQIHKDDARMTMRLCEALADLGDDRGLANAYEALVEIAVDTEPPADKDEKRVWEDRREWLEEGAEDILARVERSSIEEFVKSHRNVRKSAERKALIEFLWQLPETPEFIQPTLRQWKSANDSEIAEQAARLLERD